MNGPVTPVRRVLAKYSTQFANPYHGEDGLFAPKGAGGGPSGGAPEPGGPGGSGGGGDIADSPMELVEMVGDSVPRSLRVSPRPDGVDIDGSGPGGDSDIEMTLGMDGTLKGSVTINDPDATVRPGGAAAIVEHACAGYATSGSVEIMKWDDNDEPIRVGTVTISGGAYDYVEG